MDNNTLFEILEKPLELAEYERVMKKSENQILTKIQRIKDNVVIFKKFYNIFREYLSFIVTFTPMPSPLLELGMVPPMGLYTNHQFVLENSQVYIRGKLVQWIYPA